MLAYLPYLKLGLRARKNLFFIFAALLSAFASQAQTRGLIVKSASVAGRAVLDFNGDGYVSATMAGFSANDIAESEIPFKALTVPGIEPNSDLANGPSCGFTDFVDAPGIAPVSTYLSGGNLLFRFRLGGYAPNSKGYSILIDTDNRFGNTGANADPGYVAGNPGFEVEIELVTNQGVRLYNVDGLATPGAPITTLAYDDYAQKSIAYTTNCGDADYFYDFYMPFSVITAAFPGFTAATPVRMAANTVISTQSALQGPISDIGGVDDNAYNRNSESVWTAIITGAVATTLSSIGSGGSFPAPRSAVPTVGGPIAAAATSVSGTSTEPDGTLITVFVNGASVGTTTVTGGLWTRAGLGALASGVSVTATATATGKSVSLVSNAVVVGSTCTAPPTITCTDPKGIEVTGPAGAPTGTTIRIYNVSGLVNTGTTNATNISLYKCNGNTTNCNSGGNCGTPLSGGYWATAQETGKCESAPVFVCIGTPGLTAAPVITTNPILPSTTAVTGTSANNARIDLYAGTTWIGTTTAIGTNWTISGLTFTLGQSITAQAITSGQCQSVTSAARVVSLASTAPVVNSSLNVGATSVSGTSIEAVGTTITVFRGVTNIGSTTVQAGGTWTLTGIAPLVAGNSFKATATAVGKDPSPDSNTETVKAATTIIPVITGTYTEGGTTVSGTSGSPNGTIIKVYIDGVLLGSTTVGGGNWSLAGLSAANFDLYAGGVLRATATETGRNESAPSAGVTVACAAPIDRTLNALASQICESTSAQVRVVNSELGVIYTLRDNANTTNLSTSLLGTGGDITFQSFTFTSTQTVKVSALKIPLTTCNNLLTGSAPITVNANPPINNAVTSSPTVPSGGTATVDVANTNNGFQYQLKDNVTNANASPAVNSSANGSTVSLSSTPINANSNFYVQVTDITRPTNCTSRLSASIFVALPVSLLWLRAQPGAGGVDLDWATATETENDYFLIQRGSDGQAFSDIGRVAGAKNSSVVRTYRFTDPQPLSGHAYYRLKQVDLDEKFSYSQVVSVRQPGVSLFKAEPNPFDRQLNVKVDAPNAEMANFRVCNAQGQVLLYEKRAVQKGINVVAFELPALPAGLYLVTMASATGQQSVRVVKK